MGRLITLFVGCDVGDKTSHICVLDVRGRVVEQLRLRTTRRAFESWFGQLRHARVVIEVGTHSRWISELVESCEHEVIVANPRQVQLIYRNKRKTDHADALLLARLGRAEPQLLCPIHHRSNEAQTDLAMVRARDVLVRERTRLINHVRGILKPFGLRVRKCATYQFAGEAAVIVPPELNSALNPIVECIELLSTRIAEYDKRLEQRVQEKHPEALRLQQIPGVGLITSLAFVLTIEDPARFPTSRTAGAFFGLT